MVDPDIAHFTSLEDARVWRQEHGGWIYASDAGPAIWFCLKFTPTPILLHPVVKSAGPGQLI